MPVVLIGSVKSETDDALLLDFGQGRPQHWLPFSQIDRITRFKDGTCKVTVSNWLADKINQGGDSEDRADPGDSYSREPPEA